MGGQNRTADEVIAAIAHGQHGAVARRQLLAAGVTAKQIDLRLARSSLIIVFPGVYRAGHAAPGMHAQYMCAVLACGEGALLAEHAAAHLYGLFRNTQPPEPAVICPTERAIEGIRTRRARRAHPPDATVHEGIPVTTAARTLVDLAATLSLDDLARGCHEAQVKYGLTPSAVEEVLARRPGSRGARRLRRVIAGDVHVSLSRLERRFLATLRREGLPLPETNRPAGGRYVDCRWPELGLTVELDSYRFHNSRHSWQGGYARERDAYARGDDFRRYTYADVFEDQRAMLRELRALLVPAVLD